MRGGGSGGVGREGTGGKREGRLWLVCKGNEKILIKKIEWFPTSGSHIPKMT